MPLASFPGFGLASVLPILLPRPTVAFSVGHGSSGVRRTGLALAHERG